MNTFIGILAFISFITSVFSLFVIWKFGKSLFLNDENIINLNKRCDENEQLIKKAIKKEFIDSNGNLKKTYEI